MNEQAMTGDRSVRMRVALESAGALVSRYGLVMILVLIGILKFTPAEADGIQPLVAHSPFMSWMYLVLSKQESPISLAASSFLSRCSWRCGLFLRGHHFSEAWERSPRSCLRPASCLRLRARSSLATALKYLAGPVNS